MAAEQLKIVKDGLWGNNVALVQLLGLCPLLAVTGTFVNGLGLGLATMLTLVVSNVSVSTIRQWIRPEVRIPVFVLIIASIVTTIELAMNAWFHELFLILGIFIPLIVVNCIVLGRAEAFASKNGMVRSALDGLGMGVGFTISLAALGAVRELLGTGGLTIWGDLAFNLFGPNYPAFQFMVEAPGAFVGLGLMLCVMNLAGNK